MAARSYESEFADALSELLGEEVMALLEDPRTLRIHRLPRAEELRVDSADGKGARSGVRLDSGRVKAVIEAVARYAGVALSKDRPTVNVALPAERFRGAFFDGFLPPVTEAPTFVINASAGLDEIRSRVTAARLARDGAPARAALKLAASLRRQENGKQGEARTEWVLLKKLWVLRRSVDVEGADFVVQVPPSDDPLWGWHPDLDVLGHVQAKFFEGTNSVRVARRYVEHHGRPRTNFFLFIHTDDESGREVRYFFTAAEIARQFSPKGKYYCFSLRRGRDWHDSRDRSAGSIADTIVRHLKQAHDERRRALHEQVRRQVGDAARMRGEAYVYLFRRFEGARVVLCRNVETGQTYPLDARRDLYSYDGNFAWGSRGTGSQFLCVSLLAHHAGGREPTLGERDCVLDGLIANLWMDECNVTTEMLDALLAGLHDEEEGMEPS